MLEPNLFKLPCISDVDNILVRDVFVLLKKLKDSGAIVVKFNV